VWKSSARMKKKPNEKPLYPVEGGGDLVRIE
jgi:hypothetical protein